MKTVNRPSISKNIDRHKRQSPHRGKIPENHQTKVWRYMALWKFQRLLEDNALYLRRGDLLEDEFEGAYPRMQIEEMNNWLQENGYETLIGSEEACRRRDRSSYYINCWYISECDLDLMWKGYVPDCNVSEPPSFTPGVAIQSNIQALLDIQDAAPLQFFADLQFGEVEYGDHDKKFVSYPGRLGNYDFKDEFFRLDSEFRIINRYHRENPCHCEQKDDHLLLPVDLNQLIQSIYCKPRSEATHVREVEELLKNHGINCPVHLSRAERRRCD